MFRIRTVLFSLAVALLLGSSASGQMVTARLSGIIKDSSGGVIPGASVTAESMDSGRNWRTLTIDSGVYNFPALPVGRYVLTAELPGFKKAVYRDILLEVDQVARLDIVLELGELTESVEVTGVSPVLQTDSSNVGTVISSTTTEGLPLNGRNYIQQSLLVPGVVALNPSSFTNGTRTGGGGRPWVNGNRQQANNFQLDGIDNNEPGGNMTAYQPNVDAIQEFKMITNNVFGGTFGGPLIKNKLFFFGDYQGTRRRPAFGGSSVNLIPEAFRNGDFSALPEQIYNPFTTRTDAQSGEIVRDPFPGNQIPANLINPVARELFSRNDLYPVPTGSGLTENFITSRRQTLNNDQWDLKVDAKLSDKDDLFVRYSDGLQEIDNIVTLPILGAPTSRSPFKAVALSWTRTLSPTLVNEFRAGVNRIVIKDDTGTAIADFGNLGEELGIAGVNQRGPGLPQLRFDGQASNIGDTRNLKRFFNNTFQVGNNLSITRGRHILKTGIQVLRYQQNNMFSGNNGQVGFFNFNGQFTRDLTSSGSRGSSIADFLLGFPSQMGRGIDSGTWGHRSTLWAGFIQDDWRIRPNLTLNLGLRYEYQTPFVEVRDRQSSFDLATGRQLFAGQDGNSRGLYEGYKRNFQPRIGFAWSFADRTVLRGAYTISGFMEGTGTNLRLPLNPSFEVEFERINSNPAVLGTPITEGFADLDGRDPFNGATLRVWSPKVRPAMVQQWNLTLERQFASDFTISAGYVGQRGTHLVVPIDHNQRRLGQTERPFDAFWPQVGFVVLTDTVGNQRYDALQVSARKRYSRGLEFLGSYTWSHAMSDASGFFLDFGRAVNSFVYWANRYDQKAEWGPAASDLLQSGFPVTPWAVDQSLTGARLGRPDRIADGKGPETVGPGGFWFDPNAFAQPALGAFGSSGNGVLRGPGMAFADLGLMKKLYLDEDKYFEIRGELFNVTNSPIFNAPVFFFGDPNFGGVVVSAEHNLVSDYAPAAERLGLDAYLRTITGTELTTPVGHFSVFPVGKDVPLPNSDSQDWTDLLSQIRHTPGISFVGLNHPRDRHGGYRPFGEENFDSAAGVSRKGWRFEVDGMEVVNSGAIQSDPLQLYRDWFALLNRGYRITPLGASDSHDVGRVLVGQARTYVACEPPAAAEQLDADCVVESLKEGKVLVSMGLLTKMSVGESYGPGDLLTAFGDLEVRIEVLGPTWISARRVLLFANGSLIREAAIPSSPEEQVRKWRGQWNIPKPLHDVHLVAVALGPGVTAPYWRISKPYQPSTPEWEPYVLGSTGVIWVDADGDGTFSSAHDYAQRLLKESAGNRAILERQLQFYDEAVATQVAALLEKAPPQ